MKNFAAAVILIMLDSGAAYAQLPRDTFITAIIKKMFVAICETRVLYDNSVHPIQFKAKETVLISGVKREQKNTRSKRRFLVAKEGEVYAVDEQLLNIDRGAYSFISSLDSTAKLQLAMSAINTSLYGWFSKAAGKSVETPDSPLDEYGARTIYPWEDTSQRHRKRRIHDNGPIRNAHLPDEIGLPGALDDEPAIKRDSISKKH